MAIDNHEKATATVALLESIDVNEFKEQISQLTKQVAALTTESM